MNTSHGGATGAQIAHDKVDRYRSLGAFGKPVYQSHVQLRAMLKAKRGDRVANYFAKPTYDPDLGELRWTAEVPGAARGWHEMSGEEQAERALDLEVIRSALMSFADELRGQGGGQPGGAASFASLLDQATKVPAQGNFLYFVGDQPVIAFWGFEDQTGASIDPAAQAPRYAAAAPSAVAAAPAAAAAVEPGRKRPWWWWLLWLLLALLLLALLLLLPRGCTPDGGFDPSRMLPGAAPALPGASAAPPAGAPSEPASGAPPGGEAPPQPGAQGMPGAPGEQAPPGADAAPPGGALPQGALPGASAPGLDLPRDPSRDGALPEGPRDLPPGTDPATDLPKDGRPPGATNPPLPEGTDPRKDPAARGAQTDPPIPPLAPPGAKDMKMPDDPASAKKLDFLEGDWRAGEGLVDKATKQPLDLSFKFTKDGNGEVTVKRPDGSTCRGSVAGRMNDGKLAIQGNQAIPCSGGGSYGAPKIECQKEKGGQTQCFGVNPDGSRYYMGMRRQ